MGWTLEDGAGLASTSDSESLPQIIDFYSTHCDANKAVGILLLRKPVLLIDRHCLP